MAGTQTISPLQVKQVRGADMSGHGCVAPRLQGVAEICKNIFIHLEGFGVFWFVLVFCFFFPELQAGLTSSAFQSDKLMEEF